MRPQRILTVEEIDEIDLMMRGLIAEVRIDVDESTELRDREGLLIAVAHPDRLETIAPPHRYDFVELRRLPRDGPFSAVITERPLNQAEVDALAAMERPLVIADASGEDYFWLVRALQLALEDRVPLFVTPVLGHGEEIAKNLGATIVDVEAEGELHPDVTKELVRHDPPPEKRGFAVLFTGLSGSGKSTVANVVRTKLLELGPRPVTLLDGDVVRTHLSKGLGFSKEDRHTNVCRIAFVAAEVAKNGGAALCAPIAPYAATRAEARDIVERQGDFVLVYVSTPLAECERRDRKGLYAKARAGVITEFTGISDPYEAPDDADVVIDTTECSPEEAAEQVLAHLSDRGYLRST